MERSDPSVQPYATSEFSFFSRLPAELRVEIWRLSTPSITVYLDNDRSVIRGPSYPALLAACQESRGEAIKWYTRIPVDQGYIWIDFKRDLIYNVSSPESEYSRQADAKTSIHHKAASVINAKAQLYAIQFVAYGIEGEFEESFADEISGLRVKKSMQRLPELKELTIYISSDVWNYFMPFDHLPAKVFGLPGWEKAAWRLTEGMAARRSSGKWAPEVIEFLETGSWC